MSRLSGSGLAAIGKYILAAALTLTAVPASAGYAHYVYDVNSGKVLASDHADTLNHPASLTKMMTLYLTFEAIHRGRLSWGQEITVSKRASRTTPLKLGLRAGSKISVREAVLGSIVLSANDAAQALCDHLAGRGDCGTMMTRKARQLGMTRTVFRNGSGLPDNRQVTTARDMARLGLALMRDFPNEYRLFSTRSFAYHGRTINGHNHLMYRYRGMDGIKTGYTNASGFNIVTAVHEDGRRVIGVVMGGRTAAARDAKMAALLDDAMPDAKLRPGGNQHEVKPPSDELVASLGPVPVPVPVPRQYEIQHVKAARAEAPDTASDDTADMSTADSASDEDAGADNMSSDPRTLWQVQIAALPSEDAARGLLEKARGKAGRSLSGVMNYTQSAGGGIYRARFIGFASRDSAEGACRALKAKSFSCMVISSNS